MKLLLALGKSEKAERLRADLESLGYQTVVGPIQTGGDFDGIILDPQQLPGGRLTYQPEVLQYGNIELRCNSCQLEGEDGTVSLNRKESSLLECFLRTPNRVFSTEELMDQVWGADTKSDIHVVWTNITYLRRKLERVGANVRIRSIRGTGYSLVIEQH